jgi:hypothetical protein
MDDSQLSYRYIEIPKKTLVGTVTDDTASDRDYHKAVA